MAYLSYLADGEPHVGVVDGDDIIPLEGVRAIGPGTGTDELAAATRLEHQRVARAAVELLPSSPRPGKVFCVGLNYSSHIEETKRDLPTYPVLFPKFASNLVGADAPIVAPPESTQIDYEGELAVIIGRPGRRIRPEDALDHVLGYSVANDVTMRDYQYKTHQWTQGKAWDASTPLGPTVMTPDEVDVSAAGIRTTVNDQVVQDSDLSKLIFDIPTLIATISEFTVLEPGDVILTGTPGGVGFRRDPQLFLHPGDRVSVEIDGVGRIDSLVVAES
ncbi:fumarylacetoacetate hydrolase family protein [Herbiconiux sp. KACC 21604]|uniref:fumarylacetoacetate hydrolase family protein n=1 Tax=unclassified Herbiconiux TaxID=2618217 RepID=UPI001492B057|nr:fumarylacetoacetate hydrolase family protein [Herbiconiux sp. SALV-R1]QJU55643.1 fumarylacetoacetate hydrolase family protein [Herbiconiux sp. SALV-R1]WPO86843.1 fumarylacetoacetate hydrolase family protein [Herbiconiux sp. KACC 21604]